MMEPQRLSSPGPIADHSWLPEGFVAGQPLPATILGGVTDLSDQARRDILGLIGPRPHHFLTTLLVTWLTIVGIIWLAVAIAEPVVSLLAIIAIATRQNLLGLLVHEQSHCLGWRAKWGDIVANVFAGWPLIVLSVEGYARVHLAHHKYYFTRDDPDFMRKNGPDWTFPMTLRHLARLCAADALGLNVLRFVKGKNTQSGGAVVRKPSVPGWVRLAYYAVAAVGLTYFQLWTIFLVYWVVPLVTVLQVIVRFGAICEHKYNVLSTDVVDSTPVIVPRWWERLLLPNLNFTYHIYHHLFPGVSYRYLPRVHAIFVREGLVAPGSVFHGYAAYIRRHVI